MINLMLNDLRSPAGKVFRTRFHIQGLILHLDGLVAFTRAWAAEKRQTPLLGIVCTVLLDDLGIKHHGICRSSSTFIKKGDYAFTDTNHIRRHTDATILVRHQRVQQVLRDLQIFLRSISDFPARKMGSCISSFIMLYYFS